LIFLLIIDKEKRI